MTHRPARARPDAGARRSPTARPPRSAQLDDGSPFVLALGTIERRKNIPTLVAGVRPSRRRTSGRLDSSIAGAPGDDTEARRCVRSHQLAPGCRRSRDDSLGPVDDDHEGMAARTRRACWPIPSLDEGFGFPDPRSRTRPAPPVVASTAGSIPEIAGNAALLSPPTDVDALAANLHLAARRATRSAPSSIERGRRNLERFSWDRPQRLWPASTVDLANGTSRDRTMAHDDPTNDVAVVSRRRRRRAFPVRTDRRDRPGVDHRRRQHRRRHGAPRTVDLTGPRHDHLHAGRCDRPGARLGSAVTRPGPRWARSRDTRPVRPAGSAAAPRWFNLGDQDLATHFYRTARRAEGATLDRGHRRDPAGLGPSGAARADDRRPVRDDRHHRRPTATCRSRTTSSVCATPSRSRRVRFDGEATLSSAARHALETADSGRDRAVESDRVDRPDPIARRHRPDPRRTSRLTSSLCRRSSAGQHSRDRPTAC